MKIILHQTNEVYYDRRYIFLLTDTHNNIIVEKKYNYIGDVIHYKHHTKILRVYETSTHLY